MTLCISLFFFRHCAPKEVSSSGCLSATRPSRSSPEAPMLEAVFCCPHVSAVALHQSFSLCPHGVHLLCHLVSVSIHRSGSALGELASPGPGSALSSQCAFVHFQPPDASHQARTPGPLWHRPQLLLLLSLLTCVALLSLPYWPTPSCSVSPRSPATLHLLLLPS